MKTRAKYGSFFVNNTVTNIAWIGFLCITTLMYFNYTTNDFLIFSPIWLPVWALWLYYCPKLLYWFPIYFHLICYYLRSQLISVEMKLKLLRRKSMNLRQKEVLLKGLLKTHRNICLKMKYYNNFWSQYLTQSLIIFVSIILFLSYLYFFTFMPILPKIEFTIVLFVEIFIVILLIVSASEVSHRTQVIYQLLQSLSNQNFSIKTKLKVRSE